MSKQLTLIPAGRRQIGPMERALAQTLHEWATVGHLTGPGSSAARITLRELARLADAAVSAAAREERSEFSAASVVRIFQTTLDRYSPPAAVPVDSESEARTSAALAILRSVSDDG